MVAFEVNSQPIIGVAVLTLVTGSQPEAHVFEGLVAVESGVKVPLLSPLFDNPVVVMEFDVVGGFDLGEEGTASWEGEPELDLIGDGVAGFVCLEIEFEVEGAFVALGVDLESVELVVDKVIADDGVGLAGEVSPGVHLDAFGLGHQLKKQLFNSESYLSGS